MPRDAKRPLPRGITLEPNGSYRARMTYQGRQYSIGCYATKGDAAAALTIARAQAARGTFVPPAVIRARRKAAAALAAEEAAAAAYTVADLARDWLAFLERQGRAGSTVATYRARLTAHILPTFGAMPAAALTPEVVELWRDELDREHGNGVARPAYMTLSSMYTFATGKAKGQGRGTPPRVSVSPCQIPGAEQHRPVRVVARKVATPEEVAELAAAMPPRLALAVHLAAWCGLRLGEVLALRRRDVLTTGAGPDARTWLDITRQVQAKGATGGLHEVPPKSDAGVRRVPIPAALVPVLRSHLAAHATRGADGLLFPRARDAAAWTHPNTLRAHFNAARDEVNARRAAAELPTLDGFNFHSLRHTALSRVGMAGATLEELKRYGGHSDAATVQRYQHADLDRLARLSDLVSESVVVMGAPVVPLTRREQA